MQKILSYFAILFMSFTAVAEQSDAENTDLYTAIKAFDHAYEVNDLEKYFSYYANGATAYFGEGRVDITTYHRDMIALIAAGGGVELNRMSDLQVQITPGGDTAVATYFIDNRTRATDGTKMTTKAFETTVWQKIDGQWKTISLHYSAAAEE